MARARDAAHAGRPRDRAAALLPPCFFAVAVAFFVLGTTTAIAVVDDLRSYFYQAHVLAVTHMLTLGWISTAMLGVLYRYVPAISKTPLPFPRLAAVQGATFVAGAALLIVGLWRGRWPLASVGAAVLVVAAVLLAANLWPLLLRAPRRGVAETGVLLATGFLVAAAALATLLALDKEHPFLGGTTIGNLAAHAHLAGAGWVGVTICTLSFRFLPAFLLPTVQVPEAARAQVLGFAAAIAALAAALLARASLVVVAAALVALALLVYLALLARIVRSHRMPLDWTARHAMAGAVALVLCLAGGLAVTMIGTDTAVGARLAAAYGVAALLGWMSNLVIGMSYKLFPGFVAAARTERGLRAVPVAELEVSTRVQGTVFTLHNVAVAAAAFALVADSGALLRLAAVLLAAGALIYAAVTMRTLACAVVDPPPSRDPLRILP